MSSSAANRVPDELVSEILTPLLRQLDEEFLDRSKKPLLDPGYSSSTYLLVSKAWLRVSTPLLYNVVILRTTPQAEALHAALKSSKELGLFIKKLRVEGGFGNAMHTILKCAPNITDVFLTLYIGGLDNVRGLCDGLPLINPQRVIVVDAPQDDSYHRPKKNKKITDLLETLVSVIPKWDNLKTFHFPYKTGFESAADINAPRAMSLASALAKSQSLETLIVTIGESFPNYLRQMVHVPSLKSLHFIPPKSRLGQEGVGWGLRIIHAVADQDPKLKALITTQDTNPEGRTKSRSIVINDRYTDLGADRDDDSGVGWMFHGERVNMHLNQHGYYFSPEKSSACAESLSALTKIGETIGATVENLLVSLGKNHANDKIDPALLVPFTSLTYLAWGMQGASFSTPGPGYSALPQLEELRAGDETLEFMRKLPLNCLRRALISGPAPTALAFLQSHGTKLQHLGTTIEVLLKFDVFGVCTNLNSLAVNHTYRSPPEFQDFPDDFFSRSAPHLSLAKIHFESRALVRLHTVVGARNQVTAARAVLEQLNPESFPALKEIQIDDIKWPTSEQEARKDQWILLSEALHSKGIKVVGASGIEGPTGARAKGTKH